MSDVGLDTDMNRSEFFSSVKEKKAQMIFTGKGQCVYPKREEGKHCGGMEERGFEKERHE